MAKILPSKQLKAILTICLLIGFLDLPLSFAAADSDKMQRAEQELALTIHTIKNSRTLQELSQSPYSPHNLLERHLQNICPALLKLPHNDLALLQEELQHHRAEPALNKCLSILNLRLEAYIQNLGQTFNQKMQWQKNFTRFALMGTEPTQLKFTNKVRVLEAKKPLVFVYGDLRPKELLISFDDGPHPEHTAVILKTLEAYDAKVHFFSQGSNAVRYPEIVKQVSFYGHSIGSHSFSHPPLGIQLNKGTIQLNQAMDEIKKGHQAVFEAAGWIDPFFRFPYGSTTPELNKALKAAGAFSFFWNIDTLDWKTPDPEQLFHNTLNEIEKAGQKGIVLLHDVQKQTALMLPHLLEELANQGYTLYIFTPDNQEIRFKNTPLVQ